MYYQKQKYYKDEKVIIHWLAHHNPMREDFNNHVFYIFNHAICIGCFAFLLGGIIGLLIGNLFYSYIINFINFPIILITFCFCLILSSDSVALIIFELLLVKLSLIADVAFCTLSVVLTITNWRLYSANCLSVFFNNSFKRSA